MFLVFQIKEKVLARLAKPWYIKALVVNTKTASYGGSPNISYQIGRFVVAELRFGHVELATVRSE